MKALLRSVNSFLSLLGKISLVVSVTFAIIAAFSYFISQDRPKIDTQKTVLETRKQFYEIFNDSSLVKTKTDKHVMALYRVGICGLVGEGCTDNPADGDRNMQSSLFGMVGSAIAYPFSNPPASGMYWTRTGLEQVGFIPKTYAAQGIGFAGLQPILPIWKLMRDAALLLIVLVVVFIGFLIMFRFKINAQTVVSLENSLPRIVIALILIVFSFPIAGFLIDMMYVITALGVSLIASNSVFNIDPATYHSRLFGGNTGSLFNLVFWNADALNLGPALFSILPSFVNVIIRVSIVIGGMWLIKRLSAPVATAIESKTDVIEAVLKFVGMTALIVIFSTLAPLLLSLIIILLTGLAVFIRIFIIIFKAYIKILLRIMFAPLILMLDAIPGRKMFSNWVRGLIGDLMIVPITVIFIMLSTVIVNLPNDSTVLWQPPFLYSQQARAIYVLIGMGILYAIPNVYKMAKQMIGIKEQQGSGLGLGLFLGGIGGVGGAATGILGKYHTYGLPLSKLGDMMKGDSPLKKKLQSLNPYKQHAS